MKKIVSVCLLALSLASIAKAQGVFAGGQWSGGFFGSSGVVPPPSPAPQLPTSWVDGNELIYGWGGNPACSVSQFGAQSPCFMLAPPTYKLTLNSSGGAWTLILTGASTTPPCSLTTPKYFNTGNGYQSAITDTVGCRMTANVGTEIVVPVASGDNNALCSSPTTYCTASGIVWPQPNSQFATTPVIAISDHHAQLWSMVAGNLVGDGGIQDNIPESTVPGLINDDMTGSNMYYEAGPTNGNGSGICATPNVICGIVQVSTTTKALGSVTTTGTPVLLPLQNGYVSPTTVASTTASNNGCASGQYFINDPGKTECVTPAYGPNQTGLYATFAKTHTLNASSPYLVSYTPDDGAGSGKFSLNTGTLTSTTNYNYAQYMPKIECTAVGCIPMALCSPTSSASIPCGGSTSSTCPTGCGVDHIEIDDQIFAMCPGGQGFGVGNCPGATNNNYLFSASGSPTNSLHYTEYAQHVHLNHVAAMGDWTCLQCGTNAIAYGIDFSGCQYCSLENSKVSQAIRPGGEGHSVNLQTQQFKIANVSITGSSIGLWLGGGESNGPQMVGGNVSNTDTEERRIAINYPYSWLGTDCLPGGTSSSANNNNGCGNLPDLNFYYGGVGQHFQANPSAISNIVVSGSGPYTVTVTTSTPFNPGIGTNVVQISGSTCTGGGCTKFNGTFSTLTTASNGFTFSVSSYTGTINPVGTVQVANPGCGGSDPNVACVNVDTTGLLVTMASGPVLHDANSFMGSGHQTVHINNDGASYHIGNLGVPITAATTTGSPSFTVTVTTSLNPGTGASVSVGGMTPGACSGTFTTLSSNSTQFTYTATGCTGTISRSAAAASTFCTAWPNSTGCPTSLVLQTAVSECVTTGCTNVPFYTGLSNSLVRKNCQEMKEGIRVLVAGVKLGNVDNSGGQNGICFADAIRATSGGAGQSYYVTENNVTVQGIITRNHCDGFTDAGGRSANSGSGNGVSYQMSMIAFYSGLGYHITQTNPGCGPDSFGISNAQGHQQWNAIPIQVDATHTEVIAFASVDSGITVTAASAAAPCQNHSGNCTTYTVNQSSAAANAILCTGNGWAVGNPTPTGSGAANVIYVYGFVASGGANNSPAGTGVTPPTGFQCDGWPSGSSSTTIAGTIVLVNPSGVSETLQTLATETGTVTLSNASTAVTGVSTSFSNAWVGSSLVATSGTCAGDSQIISAVGSTTSLTLAGNFPVSCSGVSFSVGCSICGPGTNIPLYANANPIVTNTLLSNNATIGYQTMDMATGDPAFLTGCTDANFSMPLYLVGKFLAHAGVGPLVTTPTAGWVNGTTGNPASNWTASMLTIAYPWTGPATSESDLSGTCIITNVEGGPESLTYNHLTLITDSQQAIAPLATAGNGGLNYALDTAVLNSIITTGSNGNVTNVGWYNGNSAIPHEGTNTEIINYDVTSMSTWGLIFASSYGNVVRNSTLYTEFPNNTNYPETGFSFICAGLFALPNGTNTTGCTLTTMSTLNYHFPAGACAIGFNVACTGSGPTYQLPLTAADYHVYGLASSSSYKNSSPDGSGDPGAIISGPTYSIDSLQTATQYQCATPCGAGPFPD